MAQGSVAGRYAKAFLEVTTQAACVDPAGVEILALADLVDENRDLRVALSNPSIGRAERSRILEEILTRLAARVETRKFVTTLLESDRLALLRDIARDYQAQADERAGRVRAEVISASELDAERIDRIRA